jgi:hypothetical protein
MVNNSTNINKKGVELFQIGKDKTGSDTFDTVYIKDSTSVAVSSGLLFFSSEKGQLTRHLFNNHFAKLLNAGGYSLQTAVYLVR